MIDHPHGTPNRYAHGTSIEPPCREACCRTAHNAKLLASRRQRAYGRSPMVDAAQARAHVEALLARGLTITRIAERSGVSQRSIRALTGLAGDLAPSKTVRRETARKLLGFSPGTGGLDDSGDLAAWDRIPAYGARRRLQALVASGRALTVLSRELGVSYTTLSELAHGDYRATVRVSVARAVRDGVERLWNRPPAQDTPVERHRVAMARALAAREGWVPIAAWDEDEIDLPSARPRVRAATLWGEPDRRDDQEQAS